jgi:hypothetical protein
MWMRHLIRTNLYCNKLPQKLQVRWLPLKMDEWFLLESTPLVKAVLSVPIRAFTRGWQLRNNGSWTTAMLGNANFNPETSTISFTYIFLKFFTGKNLVHTKDGFGKNFHKLLGLVRYYLILTYWLTCITGNFLWQLCVKNKIDWEHFFVEKMIYLWK